MAKYSTADFKGVIPAMQTIFNEKEEINEKATREFVKFLIGKNVNGLYLTGSTGEGFLMTNEERMQVVEIVCDEVDGRIPIMVHVGDIGTKKSILLAKHAYQTGADMISSVPPFYWDFSEEDMLNYYKDISESTPLPMTAYNITLAGEMGIDFIIKLASIKNIKGVKYTLPKHYEIGQMKDALGDKFMVLSGCDEMALSGLVNGADGLIGSFYNAIPELFIDIYNAFKKGDLITAMKKQRDAIRIISYAAKHQYLSVLRHMLRIQGVESGYCRRPFKNISEDEFNNMKKDFIKMRDQYDMTGIGFLEAL